MISEEIKEKIIDLDYQGISKEKIAKMLEVSKGTVFNVVKDHEREIGKANREAIRRLANNANKNNISFEQIHKGVKINTFLAPVFLFPFIIFFNIAVCAIEITFWEVHALVGVFFFTQNSFIFLHTHVPISFNFRPNFPICTHVNNCWRVF